MNRDDLSTALRGIAYFHGAGTSGSAWVLAGYAAAGILAVFAAGWWASPGKASTGQ